MKSMVKEIMQLRSSMPTNESQREQIQEFQNFCRQMKDIGLLKEPKFDLVMIGETSKNSVQKTNVFVRSDTQQHTY